MRQPETPMTLDAQRPLLETVPVSRVAVFRALRLGDMLCAVPALRALRAALPSAHITLIGLPWAAQFAQRFAQYIDDFVAFPGHPAFPEQSCREDTLPGFYAAMRGRRFDLAIQLHGSGEISNGIVRNFGAAMLAGFAPAGTQAGDAELFVDYPTSDPEPLRLLSLTARLGAPPVGTGLEFPITDEDEEELRTAGLAPERLPPDYLCIHPGASTVSKCWPAKRFAQAADALAQGFGLGVVLTGSDKEIGLTSTVAQHMRTPSVNAAAPISIGAMAALIRRAKLLVCNDTGVSHIAAALGLPSVVIFNTADPQRWAPLDDNLHRSILDPKGEQLETVIRLASELLARTANTASQSPRSEPESSNASA